MKRFIGLTLSCALLAAAVSAVSTNTIFALTSSEKDQTSTLGLYTRPTFSISFIIPEKSFLKQLRG